MNTSPDTTIHLPEEPNAVRLQEEPNCVRLQEEPNCVQLQEEPNCVQLQEEPNCVQSLEVTEEVKDHANAEKTPDDVLGSLVNFSNVISSVVTDLQKAISENTREIASLRAEVNKLKSSTPSDQQDDGQTNVLPSIDGMRADDEYDSLLEKMEARRTALKIQTRIEPPSEEEQKKIAVDKARAFLKDLARHHNAVNHDSLLNVQK